ncbi:MAG TPA: dTDP-4-dehydrorhamnose reductase [Acetobacteraceae bacterium]|nr:dTDP-4-dehydrorhamnose reductase [Acetobacteraceae bacterium]
MEGAILVTGGAGQLATALEKAGAGQGREILRIGRPEFDFDRPETVAAALDGPPLAAIVNAAAYTAVDAAEDDADAAFRANRDGPARLAALAAEAGIPFIHVSTDYVFDGSKGAPYLESDPTAPLGVYGASKRAGEEAVLASGARAVILRTAWVISPTGRNFVRTMIAARARTDKLRVVADQRGQPTSAADLAAAILSILARIEGEGWQERFGGVFHAAGGGETTWHGLAAAVFEEAARHGVAPPEVAPIRTADWPTRARRPADSRLDCARLAATFGLRMPPWRESLRPLIDTLLDGDRS